MIQCIRLLIIFALTTQSAVSFLSAQTIGFTLKEDAKKIEIPFETFNNLIIVPVTLNNAIPLRFILDTGVQTTILTERTFSDLLNIQYHRKLTLYGADGDKGVDAYVAGNVTLELPGTVGKGQVMLVLEEDYLQLKNYLGENVHGILGYEIFRRFTVKINYDKNILTLYEPEWFKPPKGYTVIPITVEETKPYMMASVALQNNTTTSSKLMIDTGASHSLLLDANSHPSFSLPENRVRCNLGRGLGGDIDGYLGRIENISFDDFTFNEVISSFPDTSRLGEAFRSTGRQGTLGAGILKRFSVIIDYKSNKLYLKKNKYYKDDFEYNMSGLELVAIGERLNTFVIEDVREDSPADDVGLMAGDTLVKINGMSALNLDLNDLHHIFRSKDGKKIRIKIRREGAVIRKVFRLKRLI